MCMANTAKDIKHTRYIYIRMHFVRNNEGFNFHKTVLCHVGLNFADIVIKNARDDVFNARLDMLW